MDKSKEGKVLALFTGYYPYSKYEVYLENEIKELAAFYSSILIFPLKKDQFIRSVPGNARVFDIFEEKGSYASAGSILKANGSAIINLLFKELKRIGPKNFFSHFNYLFTNLLNYFRYAEVVRAILIREKVSPDTCYSNWMVDWSVVIAILKSGGMKGKFVCRAHRYDLYNDKNPNGFVPFAGYVAAVLDEVHSISADGTDYLKKQYPFAASKILTSRMGVYDNGVNPVKKDSDSIVIVTCSNIIPVKRLHLMIEALSMVTLNVTWHHFGDGKLRDELERMAGLRLKENVKTVFHGRIASPELMDFYRQNRVDLFINVSESEGIPVSIMEAISFGIPVIATDVGGTSEIVNSSTGVLIPENFEVASLGRHITSFRGSSMEQPEFRANVRKFWDGNFNAGKNFKAFAKQISDVR